MKKKIFIYLLLIVTLNIAEAQEVVKVGAFNFYPGIFQDTDGVVRGFYCDALKELGQKENIEFVFVYGSWDDGLERIKNGDVDMLTSVAITEERLNYMDYTTTPLLTVWSEVYVSPNSEIRGVLDLKGKSVAVMKNDVNGDHLKQLTQKLDVNCTFIETADFEEVFRLIADNKVDAGVVNNTFGAPKSEEYDLLSSGIVFNPFDIYITVKKDTNKELLNIIDTYLHNWQHDRNSILNVSRQKWSHDKVGTIKIFPPWFQKAIYLVFIIVLILILFITMLRYQVNRAIKKLKYSEGLFETFMDNTPAYVYIKDKNLNHIYRNKKVNSTNSVDQKDNRSSAKTIFEPHIAELVEKNDLIILSSKREQINIQYQCKLNGKDIWLDDFKFFLRQPDGNPAIGGVSFDITNLKETEQELIEAKEKAEESNRLKTAFLNNMSHEIRTPLNGITGFIGLLQDSEIDDEKKQLYFDIVNKSSDRLIATVTDIIDISRIESGEVNVSKTEVSVNEILEEQFNFFNCEAQSKGLKLINNSGLSDREACFFTDKHKLASILTNLIKNAIKFTDQGEISFACSLKKEQDIEFLEFYVKDTGIGIPANRIEAIFNRFEQADIEDTRVYEGSGLGLAIAKSYVEMLGGSICVTSEVGKGSTFIFSIPYTKQFVTNSDNKQNIDKDLQTDLSQLSVIVAEDDETSKMYFGTVFENTFKNISFTISGTETVEKLRENPKTDLILMDIKMPGMNGYDATREIRKFNSDVIIIAQTAFGLSGDREKAIQAGCNDYIAKPIRKDDLESIIKKHFKNYKKLITN